MKSDLSEASSVILELRVEEDAREMKWRAGESGGGGRGRVGGRQMLINPKWS